jgi:excisionase family DNA binding protein
MKRQQITVEVPGAEQRQIPRKKAYEIEEAAELLSLGRTILFRLLKDGQIRAKRVGGRVIISDAELERFANDPEPVVPERAS